MCGEDPAEARTVELGYEGLTYNIIDCSEK